MKKKNKWKNAESSAIAQPPWAADQKGLVLSTACEQNELEIMEEKQLFRKRKCLKAQLEVITD